MAFRRSTLFGSLLAVLFVIPAAALAGKTYSDRVGDVEGGPGPDLVSVTVSNTHTRIAFRIRFAMSPPLRISKREGWVDMLLVGIDVPPLAPRWATPRGEWLAPNFALGTHGPFTTGRIVRVGRDAPANRPVGTFKFVTRGPTISFSIPRSVLGNPARFAFGLAAARETTEETGGGADFAPNRGSFRYVLAD